MKIHIVVDHEHVRSVAYDDQQLFRWVDIWNKANDPELPGLVIEEAVSLLPAVRKSGDGDALAAACTWACGKHENIDWSAEDEVVLNFETEIQWCTLELDADYPQGIPY